MKIDKVNKIEQVAIYCRVSTIEQAEEGYSIDEQQRLLIEYVIKWVMRFINAIQIEE